MVQVCYTPSAWEAETGAWIAWAVLKIVLCVRQEKEKRELVIEKCWHWHLMRIFPGRWQKDHEEESGAAWWLGDQTGTGESRRSRKQQSRSTHWCRNQVTPLTVALIYS